MMVCIGCQWQLNAKHADADEQRVSIHRYDRIESLFLTTGDRSALQQMNTYYPRQTRTLIEDVLQLGHVNDHDINGKFHSFFQDTTLQSMIVEVQRQYKDIDDLNDELTKAFQHLRDMMPSVDIPEVYTQIGSFDQSIIVGSNLLGISLDKYLGADYPFYKQHYTDVQRSMMTRAMIVPDCLSFYILSLFPFQQEPMPKDEQRLMHMGKIQWVVNQVMQREVFNNETVSAVARYMEKSPISVEQLLRQSVR